MPKHDGHINAGRINKSRRLQIIMELLKRAEHPLSAEEISQQAYDFGKSGKIMLNVSTNIGEMRSSDNIADGYVVSHATCWKGGRYIWHDGRPRYFLLAAPAWTPRWTIGEGGVLIYGNGSGVRGQNDLEHMTIDKLPLTPDPLPQTNLSCKNSLCGNVVTGESAFCCDQCRAHFFNQLKAGVVA